MKKVQSSVSGTLKGGYMGVFNLNSIPPSVLVNVEKLDTSAILSTGPKSVSPGGKYTYEIEVRNEGTVSYSNVRGVAIMPTYMNYVYAGVTDSGMEE